MHTLRRFLNLLLAILPLAGALAATCPTPEAQAVIDVVTRASAAIVGVQVTAYAGSRLLFQST